MKSGNFNLSLPFGRRIFLLFSGTAFVFVSLWFERKNFFVLITNCSFSLWRSMKRLKVENDHEKRRLYWGKIADDVVENLILRTFLSPANTILMINECFIALNLLEILSKKFSK